MVYYLGVAQEMGQYPEERFLDGDPFEVWVSEILSKTDQVLLSHDRHRYLLGRSVNAENVPTIWQWASARTIPDFYTPCGFPCISPRMKEIVERFEPGVHQFYPLKVVNKASEQIAERWLWVVCNNIDSVDREHSNLNLINGQLWSGRGVVNPRLVFNKRQIAGRHFWRDALLLERNIICSDEAGAALESAGLTAIQLRHKETV